MSIHSNAARSRRRLRRRWRRPGQPRPRPPRSWADGFQTHRGFGRHGRRKDGSRWGQSTCRPSTNVGLPPPFWRCTEDGRGCTGKSLSEALIFPSTNPQYYDRFSLNYVFTKLKPGENVLCTEIVSDIQNNFSTQDVLQKEELLTKIYLYRKQRKRGGKKERTRRIWKECWILNISWSRY